MRWLSLFVVLLASCSGDLPPPSSAPPASTIAPDPDVIRIAGSGSMAPLVHALAGVWAKRSASPRIVVEESLGSGGGIHAAADGAVDLGMISRAQSAEERALGLREFPVARDAVVIAAHPEVAVDRISGADLCALYAGERRTFADGSPATVVLRDRGESANAALDSAVPGLAAARTAGYSLGRARVIYHDSVMVETLAATRNAFGVTSLGLITASRSSLKVLALDGRSASLETLGDGSWPATRTLAIVVRPDRVDRARPFLDFITSDEGAAIARAAGYLPTPRAPR